MDDLATEHYFSKYSADVNLSPSNGLRRGQKAAIYALAGHLSLKSQPAIAVLPTGAGKTDVAILLPYVLRTKRVLVVVPTDSVRSQIAKRFQSLSVLKKVGAIKADVPSPSVKKVSSRLSTVEEWDELRNFDVIVTVPSSISPLLKGVVTPPKDLFDLLIIDEAHHSPAKTWQSVLDAFPEAKRALFTATPFRRDRKQIKGEIVVDYTLREARKDKVFGDIRYRPVSPIVGEDPDIAIAKAAEAALKQDRQTGFEHALLIRADSIPHADTLHTKYRTSTSLNLEVVHSHFSAKRIDETIEKLTKRELDGVIAVNMLGEGFDFPNLKIAALHAPHASLGVTLQFIGRFTRVGDEKIGAAQFFAVPAEIEGEMDVLFADDTDWQELIVNLAEARMIAENRLRADIATFDTPAVETPDMQGVSLYALRPRYHVKVYRVPNDVVLQIAQEVTLPRPFELAYRQVSEELECAVIIGRERQRPGWSDQVRFGRTEYALFVIHFDKTSRLLFINSSVKADSIFRHLAAEYVGHVPKGLPLYMVNRSLASLTNINCFSIGMKNRLSMALQESYRVISGRHPQQAIQRTDGRLFHQGHINCRARDENGNWITHGYSSGSKIWSAGRSSIPSLVHWCGTLAKRITNTTQVIKAPGLDILEVGVPLSKVPDDVFGVDWDPAVYEDNIEVALGEDDNPQLADFSLKLDRVASSEKVLRVVLEHDSEEWRYDFSPTDTQFFKLVAGRDVDITIEDDSMDLTTFLNEYPLYFHCTDGSSFRGDEYFKCNVSVDLFDRSSIEAIDWEAQKVDIEREFWKATDKHNGKLSVHEYLEKRLQGGSASVVLYDHRSGEVADFLALSETQQQVFLELYHCKGSGAAKAGDRPDDLYEVCGQVVKSFHLVRDEKKLLRHIRRRVDKGKVKSRFVKGALPDVESIFRNIAGKQLMFKFVIVQPGLSKTQVSEKGLTILAAANSLVHNLGAQGLLALGSE